MNKNEEIHQFDEESNEIVMKTPSKQMQENGRKSMEKRENQNEHRVKVPSVVKSALRREE